MERRRHYDDDDCIEIAHKISGEMKDYPEDLRLWQKSIAGTKLAANGYAQRVVPLWGYTFERVVEKIKVLFHPEEATIIIQNLSA